MFAAIVKAIFSYKKKLEQYKYAPVFAYSLFAGQFVGYPLLSKDATNSNILVQSATLLMEE